MKSNSAFVPFSLTARPSLNHPILQKEVKYIEYPAFPTTAIFLYTKSISDCIAVIKCHYVYHHKPPCLYTHHKPPCLYTHHDVGGCRFKMFQKKHGCHI